MLSAMKAAILRHKGKLLMGAAALGAFCIFNRPFFRPYHRPKISLRNRVSMALRRKVEMVRPQTMNLIKGPLLQQQETGKYDIQSSFLYRRGVVAEKVMSLQAMNRVKVDGEPTIEEINAAISRYGFEFPIDFLPSMPYLDLVHLNEYGFSALKYGCIQQWIGSLSLVTNGGDQLSLATAAVPNSHGSNLANLFIGGSSKMAVIHSTTMRTVRQKKYRHFYVVRLKTSDSAIKMLNLLTAKLKKVGGISLLDPDFSQEYLKKIGIDPQEPTTHVILLNLITNNRRKLLTATRKLKKLTGKSKLTPLPPKDYDKQLLEFWMLRKSITAPSEAVTANISYSRLARFLRTLQQYAGENHETFLYQIHARKRFAAVTIIVMNPVSVSATILRIATTTLNKGGALSLDPILSSMIVDKTITKAMGEFYKAMSRKIATAINPGGPLW